MSSRPQHRTWTFIALALAASLGVAAAPPRVPKNPAVITIDVTPEAVPAGGSAEVTVTIAPKAGIKIARYPQIKLEVPAQDGLVGEAATRIGSTAPPPPDKMKTNYWTKVDPVTLTLTLDRAAVPGAHEIDGKLTYYFCVSGDFCAPARVPVKIPLAVE
jgi:hypothetical protein